MKKEIKTFRDVKRIMEGADMKYDVVFRTPEGEIKAITYWGLPNPGVAFAQCQKENPGCTMLHATAKSKIGDSLAKTDYDPPPVQRDPVKPPRPYRALKPDEKDGVMPFYDEVKSERPWS
jgi:hypothetical protein